MDYSFYGLKLKISAMRRAARFYIDYFVKP